MSWWEDIGGGTFCVRKGVRRSLSERRHEDVGGGLTTRPRTSVDDCDGAGVDWNLGVGGPCFEGVRSPDNVPCKERSK